MGKRGKRRRRSSAKRESTTDTSSATENTVSVTASNTNFEFEPWKSDVFCRPPSNDNEDDILRDFYQRWQSLQRKRQRTLTPTAIQLYVWPMWMYDSNQNIVGIAPTGSGKTLSYALPLASSSGNALVLVPTRELARQVEKEVKNVSEKKVICIYGGVDRATQVQALTEAIRSEQPWIGTATTGRLVDVLEEEALPPFVVDSIVLDEADRIACNVDMARQVDEILQRLRSAKTTSTTSVRLCLFSATSPANVQDKWKEWQQGASVCIKVNSATIGEKAATAQEATVPHCSANSSHSTHRQPKELDFSKIPPHVNQILHVCAAHKKPRKLMTTLQKIRRDEGRQKGLCLVFFARIKTLQYVGKLLNQEGYRAAEFHSQLTQSMREQTLVNFKSGKMPTLLATDVAARGIHINNIQYVINYDFPGSLDQYVHRCGRAGRDQSSSATVYSFFTRDFAPMAKDVVALLESSKAWIDPNLAELVDSDSRPQKKQRRNRDEEKPQASREEKVRALPVENEAVDNDDDWDDGQFANLNANRIVLKRASHVSDASDSSDSDDDSS